MPDSKMAYFFQRKMPSISKYAIFTQNGILKCHLATLVSISTRDARSASLNFCPWRAVLTARKSRDSELLRMRLYNGFAVYEEYQINAIISCTISAFGQGDIPDISTRILALII